MSYWCRLYIAGDSTDAVRVVGQECREIGWCVTVTPTMYVYSGGQEAGVIIEAIDYQRFPKPTTEIRERMKRLAEKLVVALNQQSYSIMDTSSCSYTKDLMPFEEKQ